MKKEAIKKCKDRLRRCRNAIETLRSAQSLEEAEDNWWLFLVAAKGIWVQLDEGASGNQKSKTWLGLQNAKRRADPLLNYIFHARDSDEHTIEFVANANSNSGLVLSPGAPALRLQRQGDVVRLVGLVPEEGKTIHDYIDPKTGAVKGIKFFDASIGLNPATDRNGNIHQPPEQHLGKRIDPKNAPHCANLALEFFEELIADAEKLV